MRLRPVRIALVVLAFALLATVPQLLVVHMTLESAELGYRDEFVLIQWRILGGAWTMGGILGYVFWLVGMSVPATFAFFPRLRRFGAAACGLLLGVAALAAGTPKVFLGAALVLAATALPETFQLDAPQSAGSA